MDDRDEISAAFERWREAVEPTVDTEGNLSALHSERGPTPGRSRWGLRIAVAAAVVVLGTAGGAMALRATGDSTQIDAAQGSSSLPDTSGAADLCRKGDVYVYLEPGADDSMIDSVRVQIERLGDPQQIRYLDQQATFDDFTQLFSGQPDLLRAVAAEDLPTSFRVRPARAWTAATIDRIEQRPGVLRVEVAPDDCERDSVATESTDGTVATNPDPAQSAHPTPGQDVSFQVLAELEPNSAPSTKPIVATNPDELEVLWATLGQSGLRPPDVDLNTSIVVAATVPGNGCRSELTGVELLGSDLSILLTTPQRTCTRPLLLWTTVLSLERSDLPTSFDVVVPTDVVAPTDDAPGSIESRAAVNIGSGSVPSD